MTAVGDGGAVVEIAARERFDVILMDFQMPTIDGLTATRLIREQEAASGRPRVPVIAMTASVLAEHRRASVDAGMDGFASKPVDWFALSHEIARVLGLGPGQQADDLPAQERQTLNRHAGVRRWSGKEDAWLEALAHFAVQHDGLAAALAALATAADYRALRMQAHKVRGVAANLGLELLADALGRLEGLVDGDSGKLYPGAEPALETSLDGLAGLVDDAMDAIRAAQPQPAGAPAAAKPQAARPAADLDRARRAANVLRDALKLGGLDDAALAGLAAATSGHPLAARVAQVHAAISDFEFDLALQQLDTVLAAIDEPAQEIAE
jgi:CheY-like chemotaxis protein